MLGFKKLSAGGQEGGRQSSHATDSRCISAYELTEQVASAAQPTIDLDTEENRERGVQLASLIAQRIVPRLVAMYEAAAGDIVDPAGVPNSAEVDALARTLLQSEDARAFDFVMDMRARGLSIGTLHTELLEPTARHLGELWEQDKIDFIDVTIGVSRLQRLLQRFADIDPLPIYDDRRRAIIMSAPGDKHTFGVAILRNALRAAGWHVCVCPHGDAAKAAEIVAADWYAVIGLSLSSEVHVGGLAPLIAAVRKASLNRTIGVMVGGPAFKTHPEWVEEVGADGTAANAPAAVLLAKKLLLASTSA
jgi:MerR family transcriptional regulator, light-induced transcriptional regulator